MLRLPVITAGPVRWRIPLPDVAAGALLELVVEATTENRSRRLLELCSLEPTLVLWAALRGFGHQQHGPRDLPAVVDYLSPRLTELLKWKNQLDAVDDASPVQVRDWADWAAADVMRAHRGVGQVADPRFLSGLMARPGRWLDSCQDPPAGDPSGQVARPSWLTDRVDMDPESDHLAATGEVDNEIRDRWLVGPCPSTPRLARLLPSVAQHMRRLGRLEEQFSAALLAEKLAAMKELAYGASHEINNPLANISTRAQTLLRDERDPERRRKLATIDRQAFRAHEMISNLMQFANPPRLDAHTVDLTELVDIALAELQEEANQQGTTLMHQRPESAISVEADATHLAMAIKALCINSLEAVSAGGSIRISTRPQLSHDGRWGAVVEVSDSGPGIPENVRPHLFDPFFSGREAGRGLGLGLSKCWRIVTLHQGLIEVDSSSHGATFTIWLPQRLEAA